MSGALTYSILQQRKRVLNFEPMVAPIGFDRTAQAIDIFDVFERYYRTNSNARFIYSISNSISYTYLSGGLSYHYGYESGGIPTIVDRSVAGATTIKTAFSAGNRTTIPVNSVTGFPESGVIFIENSAYQYNSYYFVYTSLDKTVGANAFVGNSQAVLATAVNYNVFESISWGSATKKWVIFNHSSINFALTFRNLPRGVEWLYIGDFTVSSLTNQNGLYCSNESYLKYIHAHSLNSIKVLPSWALCQNLALSGKLTIPPNVTVINNQAFQACANIVGNITIPSNVLTINYGAFINCTGITSLTLENGITSITSLNTSWGAFSGCVNMVWNNPTLPNSLTHIGYGTFYNCAKITGILDLNNVVTIQENAFTGTNISGNLIVPSTVNEFGGFYNCTQLTGELILPNSVTIIGNNAIHNCIGFTNLVFGTGVVTVGSFAFANCTGLNGTSLIFPTNIKTFGYNPFYNVSFSSFDITGCTYLLYTNKILYNKPSVNVINTVCHLDGIGELTLRSDTTKIGGWSFANRTLLTTTSGLNITNIITNIEERGFFQCTSMAGPLTFEEGITNIGTEAFSRTHFSGALILPNSITSLNVSNIFQQCIYFTSLTLGNALSIFGTANFDGMTGLTGDLIIPATATNLGNQTFRSNYNLNGALDIRSTSFVVAYYPFLGCSGFTSLLLPVNYSGSYLIFNMSSNFSADSLNQSLINITSGTKTFTIGATNKARLLAAYPNAETDANARGITIA